MSSSLFDSGVEDYSYYYAPTKYVDGDKKFEDVDKGDILYFVSRQGDHIEEIISNGKLKRSNGKLTLSTNRSGKRFIVNFGTLNYTATYDGYENSMVWIPGGYLGTNKQSVISQLIKEQQEELDKLYKQTSSLEFRINQLNNLK